MITKILPNGKRIFFKEYNGQLDFSIALQIPITDPNAIDELVKRRDFCAEKLKNYGYLGESSKNFHITMQLFYPKSSQIEKVRQIYQSVIDDYKEDVLIAITGENQVLGEQQDFCCYPAASISSIGLMAIHNTFKQRLQKNGIKYDGRFEYNPHVSLFSLGVPNVKENLFEGLKSSHVEFKSRFELSHKNDLGHFVPLTPSDLAWFTNTKQGLLEGLSDTLKTSTFTRTDMLSFFAEIKKPDGDYAYVHKQNNPRWDSFRLFFKSNPNPEEKGFWHTTTYKNSVKLLQEAYKMAPKEGADIQQDAEGVALLKYVI